MSHFCNIIDFIIFIAYNEEKSKDVTDMQTTLEKFDEIDFNIAWRRMIGMAYGDNFDTNTFRELAQNTYQFLTAFQNEEFVPRSYLGSIMLVYEFATTAAVFLNEESLAAVQVMAAIMNLFINDLLDSECSEISVEDNQGNNHLIDTTTFDLTDLVKHNK